MVEKLESRLIRITTISITVVLLLIMFVFSSFNVHHIIRDADITLLSYVKKEIRKEIIPPPPPPYPPYEESAETPKFFNSFNNKNVIKIAFDSRLDPTIYSMVELSDEDISSIARASIRIYSSGKERGFHNYFRYLRHGSYIVLLNTEQIFHGFYASLFYIFFASIFGILSVLLLVKVFSHKLLKPIIDNISKQKRFITDAGHEIKTPLSIIDADVSVIELEDGESEWSQDIKKQVERLSSLTNDLIYLSKMEESESFVIISLPIKDTIEDVAQSFLSSAKKRGLKFEISSEQKNIEINADGKRIEKLIYILFDNAIKYSTENSTIRVGIKENPKSVTIQIRNMTDKKNLENLDSLFDRFYRGDSSRNNEPNGFGIGLAIAKAIVEGHKGKISAREERDSEMTIEVILPKLRAI